MKKGLEILMVMVLAVCLSASGAYAMEDPIAPGLPPDMPESNNGYDWIGGEET